MKLSDIKGERTLEVIADLVEPVANIATDEEATALFRGAERAEGMTDAQLFAAKVKRSVPVLLKKHKGDIIAIMATIKGVTPEEYAEDMTLASVLADLVELFTDEVFVGFLA